jgi:hypothetical protein
MQFTNALEVDRDSQVLRYLGILQLCRHFEYCPGVTTHHATNLHLERSPVCWPKCFRFFGIPRPSEVSCNTE